MLIVGIYQNNEAYYSSIQDYGCKENDDSGAIDVESLEMENELKLFLKVIKEIVYKKTR